ncbi:MAG: hypothetical protein Q7Q71_00715 [Verrucomicrobiota bacterium JB023]|nr:hypothetical protein [Verrucomicrobiota bacterium JB023]
MAIDLTLLRADRGTLDPEDARAAISQLFPGIEFSEGEDPQIRFQQLSALKTPQVILDVYKNKTQNYEGTVETENGSIYVEFPSREPFESAVIEVRGSDPFNGIIGPIIQSEEWTLNGPDGTPIDAL